MQSEEILHVEHIDGPVFRYHQVCVARMILEKVPVGVFRQFEICSALALS